MKVPIKRDAFIDGDYRYWLSRVWDEDLRPLLWIMLNPSRADHLLDDPTVRRVNGYSERLGAGGSFVVNLFAYRSTDPERLRQVPDPVGPLNDRYLRDFLDNPHFSDRVVCAWGPLGTYRDRDLAVMAMIRERGRQPVALRVTGNGSPGHPLRLPYSLAPQPYEGRA